MSIEDILAFNIALLAALASPGPAFLLVVRAALRSGRLAGMATGAGLGTMATIWTLSALLGLEGLLRLLPWAYAAVKTAGALYLLYLAWGIWRSARAPVDTSAEPARNAYRQGFLINLANPKSVLFASSVIAVVFPADMSPLDMGAVLANHFAVELLFYSSLAGLLATQTVSRRYLRVKARLDRLAALILGGLGLRLLVSR